jgi:hypothetical protein
MAMAYRYALILPTSAPPGPASVASSGCQDWHRGIGRYHRPPGSWGPPWGSFAGISIVPREPAEKMAPKKAAAAGELQAESWD